MSTTVPPVPPHAANGRSPTAHVHPFRISVSESVLTDVRSRLDATRWPDAAADAYTWECGVDVSFIRDIADYWQKQYDWRVQEAELNRLSHFRATVGADALGIHFVHERAHPPLENAGAVLTIPILLLHGWPGSFYQMSKLIPLLTGSVANDNRYPSSPRFHVVAPSLPGFGFSDRTTKTGRTNLAAMAADMHELMTRRLGYTRYAIAGGDIGGMVIRQMVSRFPESIIGYVLHGDSPHVAHKPADSSPDEKRFMDSAEEWMQKEGAYLRMQATKPQTAAIGLHDSPAACAAWLIEKYRAWSDCCVQPCDSAEEAHSQQHQQRDICLRFHRDELLTFIMLYWATECMASSMRVYYDNALDPAVYTPPRPPADIDPPACCLVWPGDICVPPREWMARKANVHQYTRMARGGHFPEWEEPQLVAKEMCTFFAQITKP